MSDLIEVFRVQRHDFMNHLQVVSGLLQLGKYDQARDYIYKISQEFAADGLITRLAFPNLAAVILIQRNEAANLGIDFKCNINTDLGRINVPENVLVEIFDSLLSYALSQADGGQIEVGILEEQDGYRLSFRWMPGNLENMAASNKQYFADLVEAQGGTLFIWEKCCPAELSLYLPLG